MKRRTFIKSVAATSVVLGAGGLVLTSSKKKFIVYEIDWMDLDVDKFEVETDDIETYLLQHQMSQYPGSGDRDISKDRIHNVPSNLSYLRQPYIASCHPGKLINFLGEVVTDPEESEGMRIGKTTEKCNPERYKEVWSAVFEHGVMEIETQVENSIGIIDWWQWDESNVYVVVPV